MQKDDELVLKSGSDLGREKEVHFFLGAKGIRRALTEGAFCLPKRLAFDPNPYALQLTCLKIRKSLQHLQAFL
jgi:hypothetical protein